MIQSLRKGAKCMNKENSLQLYKYLMSQIDTGICAVNEHGSIIIYNQKMTELTGFTKQDTEHKLISKLLNDNFNTNYLHEVLSTNEPILHIKQSFWNHQGDEITILSNYVPFITLDGERIAIQFAHDITQQTYMTDRPLSRYGAPLTFDIITAVSKSMQQVIQQAKIAATGRIPVLLIGESGTGKDMIAEGIHHELDEGNERFITLLCRREDEAIIKQIEKCMQENENFTFFAERVEYLSPNAQERITELLTANEERNHYFIASIGRDPFDLIQEGKLSRNLYHLFSNIMIHVPPLRERREDIMPFVNDYLARRRLNYGANIIGLTPEMQEVFMTYDWPGNLKELEVLLDDICLPVTYEQYLDVSMLPAYFKWRIQSTETREENSRLFLFKEKQDLRPLDEYMRDVENYYIKRALELFDGNITQTAKALGLHRQGLQYRLRKK